MPLEDLAVDWIRDEGEGAGAHTRGIGDRVRQVRGDRVDRTFANALGPQRSEGIVGIGKEHVGPGRVGEGWNAVVKRGGKGNAAIFSEGQPQGGPMLLLSNVASVLILSQIVLRTSQAYGW